MSTDGKSILARYLVLSGANVAAAGFGFIVVLMIVDWFGAGGLGDISLALSVSSYALVVAAFGTEVYAVKQLAADRGTIGTMTSSVIVIRAAAALLTYGGVIVLVIVVPRFEQIGPLLALLGFSVFANAINTVWVAQAKHQTHLVAAASLVTQALYLAFVVGFLFAGSGLWGVAAARVLAELCVALASVGWVRRRFGALQPPLPWRELREFAVASAPLAGTHLLRGMTLGSDVLILGFMVDRLELGYYSAVVRLFFLMMTLAGAYFVILLPRLAERAAAPAIMRREVRDSLKRSVPLALVGCGLVLVLAAPMLTVVFGPEFVVAVPALRLLSLVVVVNLVGRHYRQVLVATGRQVVDLRMTGIGAVVHVVAKLGLIPAFGITGAALGTLVGESTIAGLLWWSARQTVAPSGVVVGGDGERP